MENSIIENIGKTCPTFGRPADLLLLKKNNQTYMGFLQMVEKIKSKYRLAGQEELAAQVYECLMQGGTMGERFLLLAVWLKQLKDSNFENYNLAYEESELIIEGARDFFVP